MMDEENEEAIALAFELHAALREKELGMIIADLLLRRLAEGKKEVSQELENLWYYGPSPLSEYVLRRRSEVTQQIAKNKETNKHEKSTQKLEKSLKASIDKDDSAAIVKDIFELIEVIDKLHDEPSSVVYDFAGNITHRHYENAGKEKIKVKKALLKTAINPLINLVKNGYYDAFCVAEPYVFSNIFKNTWPYSYTFNGGDLNRLEKAFFNGAQEMAVEAIRRYKAEYADEFIVKHIEALKGGAEEKYQFGIFLEDISTKDIRWSASYPTVWKPVDYLFGSPDSIRGRFHLRHVGKQLISEAANLGHAKAAERLREIAREDQQWAKIKQERQEAELQKQQRDVKREAMYKDLDNYKSGDFWKNIAIDMTGFADKQLARLEEQAGGFNYTMSSGSSGSSSLGKSGSKNKGKSVSAKPAADSNLTAHIAAGADPAIGADSSIIGRKEGGVYKSKFGEIEGRLEGEIFKDKNNNQIGRMHSNGKEVLNNDNVVIARIIDGKYVLNNKNEIIQYL